MANEEKFPEVRHRQVATNGITMHVAEQGELSGSPVLLIHGFPELWLSWRHQMAALAANGYRAIAPDLRGYGDTDVPADPAAYTIFHIVGDVIGLLDHLELPRVFVVGHDWGAIVAWHLCLFRPDRVKALVNMTLPYFPRHPSVKPTDRFKALGEGFYITQFQEPGRAETSIAKYGALTILKKIFSIKMDNLCAPPGMEIMDFLQVPTSLPEWISDNELQYFAEKFQKNGFTGPLNYYRNFDTNWALTAPWQGAKILVPTKFIVGDKDIGFKSFGTEMHIKSGGFKASVPDLDVAIINGCYHFIQQEKAEEVASEILSYFSSLS
ncbi:epoxide hydrolase 2-like [Carex rostrata]